VRSRWLISGLFLATFATLLVEILNTRLLSVLTWYHLSFLAVSLAMLGMAAGAVHVFLAGSALEGEAARRRLPHFALGFAVSIVIAHLITLAIPIPSLTSFGVMEVLPVAAATLLMAVPFYLSGITVTIALTRMGGSIGRLYAWDLAGASLACLLVVPLLESSLFNVSSLMLLAGAVAAAAAFCFARAAATPRWGTAALAAVLLIAAGVNGSRADGIEVAYPKNRQLWMASGTVDQSRWNSHSFVIVQKPADEGVFMWGPGAATPPLRKRAAWIIIDGEAGTPITEWQGDPADIDWVRHDMTVLPYHLRRGAAGVIGVGGGRDILAAIWGRNSPIIGIEVNAIILDVLQGSHRDFAGIAKHPAVRLVHDDARAWLTRTEQQFDVLQMSLIDTWAATGAGAFTLSENGLYTTQAWRTFLGRLTPTGIFSVSRWFDPQNVSETNRLLALAVAALLDKGVRKALDHVMLVSRNRMATLLVSLSPFSAEDRAIVERIAADEQFLIRVSPWTGGGTDRLDRIVRSGSTAELRAATADPRFDYTPPTDERPFFFNMLKPGSFGEVYSLPRGGVLWGNIRATATLVLLFAIATVMVLGIILWPLLAAGRPAMAGSVFGMSLLYFACIGLGFMLVQIALLQRFSIFLGHPTYTLSITLFAMILFAGIGSYLSDLLAPITARTERMLPVAAAAAIAAVALIVQPVTEGTIQADLWFRIVVAVGLLAPVSTLLGFFFPTGLRLVAALAPSATPWMWGVNGACGVLGSIVAVGISIWVGIQANLVGAACLYALLALPLAVLQRAQTSARAAAAVHPAGAPSPA
jgi:hypothetical protein